MFAQLVKFRLKPDTSREHFLHCTEKMVAWLKSRHGFVAYELYEGTEYWSDRIVWIGKMEAEQGSKEFLLTDIAAQIMRLVEDDYNSFVGEIVVAA